MSDKVWSESVLLACLATRYAAPAWAFFTGVANGTGFKRPKRTADAVAMSLYPSRGLDLVGFEVKVSRSDLSRELADPDKADAIAKYCDFWYVVTPPKLAQPGDLPPAWGLMEGYGDGVRIVKAAEKLPAQPLDRLMVASLLRSASENTVPKSAFDAMVRKDADARVKETVAVAEGKAERALKRLEEQEKNLREFTEKTGISVTHWDHVETAAAYREFLAWARDRKHRVFDLENAAAMARAAADGLEAAARVARDGRVSPNLVDKS